MDRATRHRFPLGGAVETRCSGAKSSPPPGSRETRRPASASALLPGSCSRPAWFHGRGAAELSLYFIHISVCCCSSSAAAIV